MNKLQKLFSGRLQLLKFKLPRRNMLLLIFIINVNGDFHRILDFFHKVNGTFDLKSKI